MLSVGSLFSGIGGFDLGLERAGGFYTAWFCEQDPFCRAVLEQHWPGRYIAPDITELRKADVARVDVLCGGFPCQDISAAGTRRRHRRSPLGSLVGVRPCGWRATTQLRHRGERLRPPSSRRWDCSRRPGRARV